MEKAVYVILIFCGILSQGICYNQENNKNSSDLLIRQKRVVGGSPNSLQGTPYLLNVLENGRRHCLATLLTSDFAISSATCFINHNRQTIRIESRSIVGQQLLEILRVFYLDPNFNPARPTFKNLVLVRFTQTINFQNSHNRPITIFSGNPAAQNLQNFVVGWGRSTHLRHSSHPETLRFLSVILVSIEYCQNIYHNVVGAGNICTLAAITLEHSENKDTGAPLISNNHLLGIFVYREERGIIYPDVFMNLLDHGIRRWIHEHIPSLGLF